MNTHITHIDSNYRTDPARLPAATRWLCPAEIWRRPNAPFRG